MVQEEEEARRRSSRAKRSPSEDNTIASYQRLIQNLSPTLSGEQNRLAAIEIHNFIKPIGLPTAEMFSFDSLQTLTRVLLPLVVKTPTFPGITLSVQPNREKVIETLSPPALTYKGLFSTPSFDAAQAHVNRFVANLPASTVTIPDKARTEHVWICGEQGQGKTELLATLIKHDWQDILDGKKTVIVLDSEGRLIPKLSSRLPFADHPDRLTVIEPSRPPALNIFDFRGDENPAGAIHLYHLILNSILKSDDISDQQGNILTNLLRLMTALQRPTIDTVYELTDNHKTLPEEYRYALPELPARTQNFLLKDLYSDGYRVPRQALRRRLDTLLGIDVFTKMLTTREKKFDMLDYMNRGGLILIDTDKQVLHNEFDAFGSFFVSLIYKAVMARKDGEIPCFIYMDEGHEYLKANKPIVKLLYEQARKRNCGICVLHQNVSQLDDIQPTVAMAVVKIFGPSQNDMPTFTRLLNCNEAAFRNMPMGSFLVGAPRYIGDAVPRIDAEIGVLDKIDAMSERQHKQLLDDIYARYAPDPDEPPDEPDENNLEAKPR